MLLEAGVNASFVAAPGVTVKLVLALVRPLAVTVMVAVPTVVAVTLEVATPAAGVTGEAGLNEPVTPVTANVIAFVAVVTVLPLAS